MKSLTSSVFICVIIVFIRIQVSTGAARQCRLWTKWFNSDTPSGEGDLELTAPLKKAGKVCADPSAIQAQLSYSRKPFQAGGNRLHLSVARGLLCYNKKQRHNRRCKDYRIRYCCDKADVASRCTLWTKWFNRDSPAGTGDWETIGLIKKENPKEMCAKPYFMDAKLKDGRSWKAGRNRLSHRNIAYGLVCRNRLNRFRRCNDYAVRFCCKVASHECTKWTEWFNRDSPRGTGDWEVTALIRKENPGKICAKPTVIHAELTNGRSVAAGGDTIAHLSVYRGLICLNKDQNKRSCRNYRVRYCCEA